MCSALETFGSQMTVTNINYLACYEILKKRNAVCVCVYPSFIESGQMHLIGKFSKILVP